MMDLRHLLMKYPALMEVAFVTLHVSGPYRMPDSTLVLNISTFPFLDIPFDRHTCIWIQKAVFAFSILACMCQSDLPSLLMILPSYAEFFTSSLVSPSSSMLSTFLMFTVITSAEIFASRVSLDCMPWWLCERRPQCRQRSPHLIEGL